MLDAQWPVKSPQYTSQNAKYSYFNVNASHFNYVMHKAVDLIQ